MRALAIRHVEIEHLGILERVLEELCIEFDYLDAFKNQFLGAKVEDYSLIIVLGGPMGAYEEDIYPFLKYEFRIIGEAIKRKIPLLGICLGAQMIAKALGARVYRGENGKEIGWTKVWKVEAHEFFSKFPEDFEVLQWHQDTFDLPKGAIRVYSSQKYHNQAFVYGKAVGLQFHIEVTREMIEKWAEVYSDELEKENVSQKEILKFEREKEVLFSELIGDLLSKMLR